MINQKETEQICVSVPFTYMLTINLTLLARSIHYQV